MIVRSTLGSAVAAAAIALLVAAPQAHAAELTFASLESVPGIPSIFLNLSDLSVSSFDIADVVLPVLDPGDPFATSSPVEYTQGATVPAFFKMPSVAFVTDFDANTRQYGPGSFSIGIDTGITASTHWITGAFNDAFLFFSDPASPLSGAFFNFGGVTFSGAGFDLTGLSLPGSFAFALGNPVVFTDQAGAPSGIGYEITAGALAAQEAVAAVPEPSTMLLLGSGLVGICYRRIRRRARR